MRYRLSPFVATLCALTMHAYAQQNTVPLIQPGAPGKPEKILTGHRRRHRPAGAHRG